MVQSLPGFLNLSLNVCSPSQVLGDVYTEVLEATHPLHRGPTDHKRSVGPLLSLPEVHDQLLSFAHVQRETVVLAPWCESLYLIQVCGLVIVVNEAQNHSIIRKWSGLGSGLGLGVGLELPNPIAISMRGVIIWQGVKIGHNTSNVTWSPTRDRWINPGMCLRSHRRHSGNFPGPTNCERGYSSRDFFKTAREAQLPL